MARDSSDDLSATYRRYVAALVSFHLAAADDVGLSGTDYQATNLLGLDGPLTSGDLAARLGLTTGATTRLIDRLSEAGYVRRREDPQDRRRVLVEHTGRIPARLTKHLRTVQGPIRDVLAGLSDEERAGVVAYLEGATEAYRDASSALRPSD